MSRDPRTIAVGSQDADAWVGAGADRASRRSRFGLAVAATWAIWPGTSIGAAPEPSAETFTKLKTLAGEWQADLPGFGKMQDSIRLISKGTAVEETLGTPSDNETSVYTRDETKILMTHYCAMTADGHQVRLETASLDKDQSQLEFLLVGSDNLHDPRSPHMRLMSLTLVDRDHFSERWTKTEDGKDTVFEMHFTRR